MVAQKLASEAPAHPRDDHRMMNANKIGQKPGKSMPGSATDSFQLSLRAAPHERLPL
jgi:hypothetical protein